MKDNKNEFKKDLHEWLAEMKRRREVNRKRDEEQAVGMLNSTPHSTLKTGTKRL